MPKTKRQTSKVLAVRELTGSASVVRFERHDLKFEPGQYVRVGVEGDPEIRDYSVYSSVDADHLEVLVRRVEDGLVSKQLCDLKSGDEVNVGGPYGHFKLTEEVRSKPLLFVSTGTGISPFHCFVDSHPGLDSRLLHGTA
jgi:ferredoxin--NADP+ reductase/benzoate/toluate 1,2-dioxygenase reductase subunit